MRNTASPPVEMREPTEEELASQGEEVMMWVRSMGHECGQYCRPPFSHTSSGAAEAIAKYLLARWAKRGVE